MAKKFLHGERVAFRGHVGTVEAVDLTPGMVDVRYGNLVKRHRREDVSSVSGIAKNNSSWRRARPARARRNGRLTDEVTEIQREIEAELASLQKLLPSDDVAEQIRDLGKDADKDSEAFKKLQSLTQLVATVRALQARLQNIHSAVFGKVIKKEGTTRFQTAGELEDAAAAYLDAHRGRESQGPIYGFTGLGPAGPEEKDRRTKIPLTEKELFRKALLERGYSGTGAQLAEESAAWMTLPDPARYVDGELCGNPIDGTMYVIAVNSKKRFAPVLVTPNIWEKVVKNAGNNRKLDTPEKMLEAWSKMQTDFHELRRTIKRYGKGYKDGVLQPFTLDEVEKVTNPEPGFKRPGPTVRARPGKGMTGKAARGPAEQYTPAEKERQPPPADAQYVEDPKDSGKYYFFRFDRKLSTVSQRFLEHFSPPYDRYSKKKDSPFFAWERMLRPFSRGGLEGNLFGLRVDTTFFGQPGSDPQETLRTKTTKVTYLSSEGPWARVRLGVNGPEGYVQRHHLVLTDVSPFTQPPLCSTSVDTKRVKAAREVAQYLKALKDTMYRLRSQIEKGIENPDHPLAYIEEAGQRFLRSLAWVGSWCQSMTASLLRQPVANYRHIPVLEIVASIGPFIDLPLLVRLAESAPVPLVKPNRAKLAYVAGAEEAGVAFDAKLLPNVFLPATFSGGNDSVVGLLHARLRVVRNLRTVILEKWRNASHPHPDEAILGLPQVRSLYLSVEEVEELQQLEKEYAHPATTKERKVEIEETAKEIRIEMEPLDKLRALYFMYHSMGGPALERDLDRALEHVRLLIRNAGSIPPEEASDIALRLRDLRKTGSEHPSIQHAAAERRAADANLKELVDLRTRFRHGEDVSLRVKDLLKRAEERVSRAMGEEKDVQGGVLVELRNALNSTTPELLDHLIHRMTKIVETTGKDYAQSAAAVAEETASLSAQARFHKRGDFPFSGQSNKDVTLYYTYNPLLFEIARLSWNTKQSAWKQRPDGALTPESMKRLRDVDTVGRYGYALKLFYEKALSKKDFQAVVSSLEATVQATDFRSWLTEEVEKREAEQKVAPYSPEQLRNWNARTRAVAETFYPHVMMLESGQGDVTADVLSEDPRAYLSTLRRSALNTLVRQREATVLAVREHVEEPSARSSREAVATLPLQPLAAAKDRYKRTPLVGEGKPVPTSFLPQSTIAALEDAENDSQQLRNLIQERAAELRKKLPRSP